MVSYILAVLFYGIPIIVMISAYYKYMILPGKHKPSTPLADHYLKHGYAFVTTKDIDPGTKVRIPALSREEEEINKALEVEQHFGFGKFLEVGKPVIKPANEFYVTAPVYYQTATTTTSAAVNFQGVAIWDQKGEKVIGVEKVNTNNSNKPMRVVKRNYDYEIMKRFFEGNI